MWFNNFLITCKLWFFMSSQWRTWPKRKRYAYMFFQFWYFGMFTFFFIIIPITFMIMEGKQQLYYFVW